MATKVDYYETGADSAQVSFSDYYNAQTFTASKSYIIVSCKVKIYRVGNPGTGYVQFWATSSDKPSGGAITNGSFNGNNVTTDSGGEWQEVTFNDPVSLTQNTKYALVLLAPSGSSSNKLVWIADSTSPSYSGGNLCESSNGGVSWSDATGVGTDMYFETYEAESGPANVKTIDGLAKASVKAVDGLAIGSVKSINGLT